MPPGAILSNSVALFDLVAEDAEVERIATDFQFVEGPLWNLCEECLLFSDIPSDVIYRWDSNGVDEWRKPSRKSNGLTYDAEARLIVCEHETLRITRTELDGGITVVASHYEGKELNGPNDVVVAFDGSMYFTDTSSTRTPYFGVQKPPQLDIDGVYRVRMGEVPELLVDDFSLPNGLCFSPNESLLYVNDTLRRHIRVFDVGVDGRLSNGRLFFEGIGTGALRDGAPDGMKVDERGNVYCTGPGGIWVISGNGQHLGIIETPEVAANLNWGDSNWSTLYICAASSVYRVKMRVGGNRVSYMREEADPVDNDASPRQSAI
jgi:gluconolactonase